jgi:TldD protein
VLRARPSRRFGQKRGPVHHDPGDPPGADQAAAVALEAGGRDGEDEAPALDLDQRRLGQHHRADGDGGEMVELHPGRDARLGIAQVPVDGADRRLFAQRDEPGRGEDGDVARAEALGGVLFADGELELRAEASVRPVPGGGGWIGGHDDYDTAVPDTALIDSDVLERVLSSALAGGGDMAEVFAEDAASASAMLDDRRVEELSSGRSRGAGIRVVDGETTGFAHTADLSEPGLLAAARAAAAVAHQGNSGGRTVALDPLNAHGSGNRTPPDTVDKARKLDLLTRADDAARASGDAITQVQVGCGDSRRRLLVANSEGLFAQDDQIRTRFNVVCVANGDTGLQTAYESVARTEGFEIFERHRVEDIARRAAERAMRKLSARPAPSGEVPVVLAGGSGGILFHEACGHGLEADHIVKDASVYTGQIGELVASPLVTLVDDGTVLGEWGNFDIDDEGHAPARNVLIENGVLTDYMWDWLRARKEGRASSGNGRRQSYQHLPMVRMTNTYLLAGSEDPDEIVAQTPSGVYVKKLGGGQVNTATGDFVFGTTEAYLIENGRITEPLRDANLIGNGPEVLRRIDAVATDFDMTPGTCGKDGQSVPVGCGQATLRITGVTLGGTA